MFDVGFAEIFLLGLIGLLVLGPERLPAVARTLGGLVRKARASWAGLRSTIEAELAEADITNPIKEVGEELKQIGNDLKPDMPDVNSILNPASTSSDKNKSETGTDAENEAVSQTETETTDSSTAHTGADAEVSAEPDVESDTRLSIESDDKSQTALQADADAEMDLETSTLAEVKVDSKAKTESKPESESENEGTPEWDEESGETLQSMVEAKMKDMDKNINPERPVKKPPYDPDL